MVQEECAELIAAINRMSRERPGAQAKVVEETVDVWIVVHQARQMLSQEDTFKRILGEKRHRLAYRLDEEEKSRAAGNPPRGDIGLVVPPEREPGMSMEAVATLARSYIELLETLDAASGLQPPKAVRDPEARSWRGRLSHLMWMCQMVASLEHGGRNDKAMRWFGFVQGAMWSMGIRTVDQMRDDNVGDSELPEPA